MPSQPFPRFIAAGVVIGAAAAVLLWQVRDGDPRVALLDTDLAAPESAPPEPVVEEPAVRLADDTSAADKIRELEAMSETFRNTTFVIAIREAGFTCRELLRVYGGIDDAPKWMATCSEMLAYTISVASTGALQIEPMLQYFDGVPNVPLDRNNRAPPQPRLEPRPLGPPR